jgi:hypothetical protein
MNRQSRQIASEPTPSSPHFGTFPFFQPLTPTAHKNVKEPKFSNRTPTAGSLSTGMELLYKFPDTTFILNEINIFLIFQTNIHKPPNIKDW